MSKKHIMIDLETLGTKPNSIFISIGAVGFDPATGMLGRGFYCNVDVASSQLMNRTSDESTIKWWEKQGDAPKEVLYKDEISLQSALVALTSYIKSFGGTKVMWANSPSFDLVMLEDAYNSLGMPIPWQFWNTRDCRTMVEIGGSPKTDPIFKFEGIKHYALDDARHQAKYVSAIWQSIKKL